MGALEPDSWSVGAYWDLLQQLFCYVAWLQKKSISVSKVSSFDLRSRHTAGRDPFNEYLGNTCYDFVQIGNVLASRLILMLMVISAKGARYIVEQPSGSCLKHHPRFQQFLKIAKVA